MIRPFLKFAGCKFQILDKVLEQLPKGDRLIEPFVGSGVVSLNADYEHFLISDQNADLMNVYMALRKDPDEVIKFVDSLFTADHNNRDYFRQIRRDFNAGGDQKPAYRAAVFIYLNRHCFNGLIRYNKSGHFNTPFGSYATVMNPRDLIRIFADWMKTKDVVVANGDFEAIMTVAVPGDVIYCDPPYVPLSDTAKFTGYCPYNFNMDAQRRLARIARETVRRGIPVVLSNHDLPFVREQYADADSIISFKTRRHISANVDGRGEVDEVLIVYKGESKSQVA